MSAHIPINDQPIESPSQLLEYMLQNSKSKDDWVIGTEHEKFLWSIHDQKRPAYHGDYGVEALLKSFENDGWHGHYEGSDIIALTKNDASITLEPGGQFELSGAPLKTLQAMSDEIDAHMEDVHRYAKPLGLLCSGLGSDATPPSMSPRMPKARYDIMRNYLPTKGKLALHMMHNTATVQCNLDFSNAEDAMQKLRVSLYLQPIVMAMFANSFVLDQQLRAGHCARSQIWLHTDPDRYLYPASFLQADTPMMEYVQWVLDVPMFFIAREGKYLDCAGLPFSQFMQTGWQGHQATIGDFALHLSTIFPDARLKQHLEVRAADMSNIDYCKALSALHVGLLYDEKNLDHLSHLFEVVSAEQLWHARAQLDQNGLQTMLAEDTLLQWSEKLLMLAKEGLQRYEPQAQHLLNPVIHNIQQGKAPSDLNRQFWSSQLDEFMRHCTI